MGQSGNFGTPPIPGTPTTGSVNRPPPLISAADLARGPAAGGPVAPPSPTPSAHSLHSLAQSLNQQIKAGRHPTPPPPPSQPGASPSQGSSPQPPPAPTAP